MCTNLLKDSRTFEFLQQIDRDTETRAGLEKCRFCGDRLHRGYYLRKPRAPGIDLSAEFCVRPSFCCRRDGCRRRMTPALLRFLGRKVYVSIVVVLVAAMTQGPSAKRLCAIEAEIGIAPQTVRRWCHYWREIFVTRSAWLYQRGNFMPPVDEKDLPLTFLSRFGHSAQEELAAVCRLIRLANDCTLDPIPQSSY